MEEQRGGWRVRGEHVDTWATLSGSFRHRAETRGELPAAGDWVGVRGAVIEHLFTRRSHFSRQAAGKRTAEQVIAANVDTLFVMTSLNRDLNVARLERYLTSVWESGATPVVLLSKSDLVDDPAGAVVAVETAAPAVTVVALRALDGTGLEALEKFLQPGHTVALVGSSGVGKSTLVNRLLGRAEQAVVAIREDDDRGRHATTSRRLIPLPGGALLLDTPGMRELQLWETGSSDSLERVFPEIEDLSAQCRFRDCKHESEPGCAVRERADPRRLESFHKLGRELQFAARKQDAALEAAFKKKWKRTHKAMREFYRDRE